MDEINGDLVDAAGFGNLYKVGRLLDQGADINYLWPLYNMSALMMAVSGGKDDIVELLLERGANPNIQDDDGFTALMLSAVQYRDNNTEIIELLLAHGANLHIRNNDGQTALTFATIYRKRDNAETLIRHENIIRTQRLTRRRNTRRRIKTIKNKKMLSFAKTQDMISDFIGQDMPKELYSNIANRVSNMKYGDSMPRMTERIDPYNEWLQDMRSD